MHTDPEQITYFAETDFRNKKARFGIKAKDRSRHLYTIGKTGMGKSTMLENMAIQDIQNGNGVAFIDPHGSAVDKLLDYVPEERIDDVVYFAPFDVENPMSFNVLEDIGKDKRNLVANGLLSVFKKIWADQWSSRMEYFLVNTLLALLEYPDATIMDINRMLVNKDFRKDVISHITDPAVKSFWTDEFATYTDTYTREATPAIQNKIGQFVSNPVIRNIVGQAQSSFDVRDIMDNKKILLMNLSKGRIGEENAKLIGSMLIVKIYLAALSRAELTSAEIAEKPYFYFFVDEFQSFANESFADILSESRKYNLCLTIAHQYVEQMPETVRDAVFGNVGTMIIFRVGSFDAEIFEKEFAPQFTSEDIVSLDFSQIYLKLMIDGVSSRPFSATTLPPIEPLGTSFREQIIESSRAKYALKRDEVEQAIEKRMVEFPMQERPKEESGRSQFKPSSSSRFSGKQQDSKPKPARTQSQGSPSSSAGERPARSEHSRNIDEPTRAGRAGGQEKPSRPPHKPSSAPKKEAPHSQKPQEQRKPKPNPDDVPPEESKNQLRDALTAALKEKGEQPESATSREDKEKKAPDPSTQSEERPKQEKQEKRENVKENSNDGANEIPEETLRDVLK